MAPCLTYCSCCKSVTIKTSGLPAAIATASGTYVTDGINPYQPNDGPAYRKGSGTVLSRYTVDSTWRIGIGAVGTLGQIKSLGTEPCPEQNCRWAYKHEDGSWLPADITVQCT